MKRLTRPRRGFPSFGAARCTRAGMEVRPALRKGQLTSTENAPQTPAEQVYALAAELLSSDDFTRLQLQFAAEPFAVPVLS